MPRLPPSLIVQARATNPLLVPLLRTCRDLVSASNELRWLTQHVEHSITRRRLMLDNATRRTLEYHLLSSLCARRSRGTPLQYLLGTEYFGDLELAVRPGVLIPRPETADITSELARRLKPAIDSGLISGRLKILDLCTGTGCMALLLCSELQKLGSKRELATSILGVDISSRAIQTALSNKHRLGFGGNPEINFLQADIWDTSVESTGSLGSQSRRTIPKAKRIQSLDEILSAELGLQQWDIVVANPPYISPDIFKTSQVEKSVRHFEPRLALVPPKDRHSVDMRSPLDASADSFYPRILNIAENAGAKVVLVEVGRRGQALRVKDEVEQRSTWDEVEIWNDGINAGHDGKGLHARAVVAYRAEGKDWL